MGIAIKDLKLVGNLYGLPLYTSPSIGDDQIWLGYIKEDADPVYGLYARDVETVVRIEGVDIENNTCTLKQ